MNCEQARQLFDAYLDGELSPQLATELGAHRVRCADCRRDLALMEVTGHIIGLDRDPVQVDHAFTDRLLACMESGRSRWTHRLRHWLYVGGPLAAAAIIMLAFIGVFDPGKGKTLGVKEEAPPVGKVLPTIEEEALDDAPQAEDNEEIRSLDAWLRETQERIEANQQSGESLQQQLDLTISQWLDILDKAKHSSEQEDHFPGADMPDNDESVQTGRNSTDNP